MVYLWIITNSDITSVTVCSLLESWVGFIELLCSKTKRPSRVFLSGQSPLLDNTCLCHNLVILDTRITEICLNTLNSTKLPSVS